MSHWWMRGIRAAISFVSLVRQLVLPFVLCLKHFFASRTSAQKELPHPGPFGLALAIVSTESSAFVKTAFLRRAVWTFVVVLIVSCPYKACLAALTDEEVRALVEHSLAAQQAMDHASWKVKTDITSVRPNGELTQQAEGWIRRDGNRVDSQGQYLYQGSLEERSYRFRSIVDGEQFIQYTTKLREAESSKPVRTAGAVSKSIEEYLYRTVGVSHFGGALDGYLGALGHARLTTLMLRSNSLRHLGQESIGGKLCEIVESDTEYGRIRLWIAPASGHAILQFHFDGKPKTNDHSVDKGQVQSSPVKIAESTTLDNVELAEIEGGYIPIAGKLTIRESYSNNSEVTTVYASRRNEIDLNPDWTGSDAFRSDMVDGTPIFDWDHKGTGIRYEWQDGKVVPAHADFDLDPTGQFGGSRRTVYFVIIDGALLLILGIILFYRNFIKSRV